LPKPILVSRARAARAAGVQASKRRAVGRVEGAGVEGEGVALGHPPGDGGGKGGDELAADVEEGQAGRSEEVFQSAGDEEIDIESFDVERAGAAVLGAIEEDEGATLGGDAGDGGDVGAKKGRAPKVVRAANYKSQVFLRIVD